MTKSSYCMGPLKLVKGGVSDSLGSQFWLAEVCMIDRGSSFLFWRLVNRNEMCMFFFLLCFTGPSDFWFLVNCEQGGTKQSSSCLILLFIQAEMIYHICGTSLHGTSTSCKSQFYCSGRSILSSHRVFEKKCHVYTHSNPQPLSTPFNTPAISFSIALILKFRFDQLEPGITAMHLHPVSEPSTYSSCHSPFLFYLEFEPSLTFC